MSLFALSPRVLAVAAMTLLPMAAVAAEEIDLSPEQPGRIRVEKVQAAIDLLPPDYRG